MGLKGTLNEDFQRGSKGEGPTKWNKVESYKLDQDL